ncbi:hypothetical protein NYQ35_15955 [Curtobacterium flaccumfaciens pv. flaccumfaciens]|uniref:hypothetical protein n=1 Tax=Curtobacterium flaccumfaciens TaxID=2035 RepID=UPI00217DBDDB|nr:hypothetical protein [Curtobacterium flaccumfaciens]MCS6570300.1 hypothetical protein [Curtobacterium flaccumfaciens pv. flaccumfaciens]MCS6585156.1 hypothetical protein [Curtobacterium flaccumfaciens pv. flaccumfaciens]
MRIRSTKPEFWRSKTIAALPWDVRLVLKGLESYVDDNGVGKDDIALIAADVFPRDLSGNPRDTLARLSEAISALHDGGLIARYVADSEDLLYIGRWKELQRIDKPGRGRFPRPDGTLEYGEPVDEASYRVIRETVARHPERVAPGTGEQGNRGTGEQGIPPLSPADADDGGTLIPDSWQPNQGHRDKAASLRLDVDREAQRFVEHAHRKVRRLRNWNTGFTNWLRKQAEFAQQRQGAPVVTASRGTRRDDELMAFMTRDDDNTNQQWEIEA